ncbi:hypothetical protein HMN09_00488800 [Mycena chlorophos]|uniref:Uncharacterized protein n=1 Tax=Mycena chlorophos TaxID=658473 RepID=A0A8H6T7N1_MYCCL|nr:hypothetical protein HMN09_00488800 [Mycena chlorophos]
MASTLFAWALCWKRPRPHCDEVRDPIPTQRLDMTATAPATAPECCYLLQLPTELRLVIFDVLLANHTIQVWPSETELCGVEPAVFAPDPNKPRRLLRVPYLGVAVLETCRQLYLEGLPVFHQRNIFQFDIRHFAKLFPCAPGLHCVGTVRHVSLLYSRWADSELWTLTFDLLRMMQLETLSIISGISYNVRPLVESFALNKRWGRQLLAIRGLRALDITLSEVWLQSHSSRVKQVDSDGREVDGLLPLKQLVDEYRTLMVGPKADERYLAFLAEQTDGPLSVA